MYNVLLVLNFSNSFEGSFIRSVKALSEEIEKDSGKVVYLLPEESKGTDWVGDLDGASSPVFYFKNSLAGLYQNTKKIKKIIKEYNINIIHSHFADYRQHLPIALARAGKKDIDYIVHSHREPVVRNHLYDKLAAFVTNATLYIAVSESIKNKLSINGRRAVTLLNGVDFSRLELSDPTVKKSDWKTDGYTQNILMFGYDFEEKGVDFVINTLTDYDPEHKFRLLIAVSENVDEATKAVREACGEVPDWIKLLPARNDVATYYKLADVFILANRHEGSPYTAHCGDIQAAQSPPAEEWVQRARSCVDRIRISSCGSSYKKQRRRMIDTAYILCSIVCVCSGDSGNRNLICSMMVLISFSLPIDRPSSCSQTKANARCISSSCSGSNSASLGRSPLRRTKSCLASS